MTLINKIIRILPKKQVDVHELERNNPPRIRSQAETVMKSTPDISIYPEAGEPNSTEVEYEIVEREILPEKIVCPDCGGITLEGLEFCDKCGGELKSE